MIPTEEQAKAVWEKYALPEKKRIHVSLVRDVALFLAHRLAVHHEPITINQPLLSAAALLHDIDKAISKLPGEVHPDTAVRVLREERMEEVAAIVKTHSLHAILDPAICPTTWEERLLYLADKMVKFEVITVDKRFALWRAEDLPDDARLLLDQTYPRVKAWEKEIFSLIGIAPAEVAGLVTSGSRGLY